MKGKHLARMIRFWKLEQRSSKTEQWGTTIYSLRVERKTERPSHLNHWIFLDPMVHDGCR